VRTREDRVEATVFIAELEDPADSFMLTGLFYGHLERDDDLADQFEGLPADEAIAWGRERAGVVLVRTGESDYYSAGAENPDGLPEWPPPDVRLERRRARGFEALDNTEDDAPALWDVRVEAETARLFRTKPFRDAVRRHPAARDVRAPAPGYAPASASFLVEASTIEQARAIAHEITQEGLSALDAGRLARRRRRGVVSGYEVYPYRPGEEVTGPGIYR
jgi:hypothetical protein